MSWQYEWTPFIWPMLVTSAMLAGVAFYALRRRVIPGAVPLAVNLLFPIPWALSAALELAAVNPDAKIFWEQVQNLWPLPTVTAGLWFAVEYSDLGHWLSRRKLALLFLPPLIVGLLVVTNNSHHWLWRSFATDGYVRPVLGFAGWIVTVYGFVLALATSLIFVWLFVRSPLHRWPAGLCLLGQIIVRVTYVLEISNKNPVAPMNITLVVASITAGMYAIALFGFRMLDLLPIARSTVLAQMREGMLVLDTKERIADLNHELEKILDIPGALAKWRSLSEFVPELAGVTARFTAEGKSDLEITRTTAGVTRQYALNYSSLKTPRGMPLGHLILFRDVSEQRQAQALRLQQQRALATLEERDRIACELHDGVGQVLAYAKLQAEAVRLLLARDQRTEADDHLAQLIAVAQDAHGDVREYIEGARTAMLAPDGFLTTLRTYVQRFSAHYKIAAEVEGPAELSNGVFDPMVEAQLLRIIQEALTNVRKHAHAQHVYITVGLRNGGAETTVRDDGAGFDPALLQTEQGQKYGLHFMRHRAEEVGGTVQIESAPGFGTTVVITVPLRKRL